MVTSYSPSGAPATCCLLPGGLTSNEPILLRRWFRTRSASCPFSDWNIAVPPFRGGPWARGTYRTLTG